VGVNAVARTTSVTAGMPVAGSITW
jgi:hypothetical protein